LFRQTTLTDKKIAAWVPDSLVDEFVRASEVDRCAMCYIEQYQYLLERRDCLVVDFDQLVRQPHSYFGDVVDALGERFGPLTPKLLDSVRETSKDRAIPLNQIAPERRRRMAEIYDACRQLAMSPE
jgi:hypothetical protein